MLFEFDDARYSVFRNNVLFIQSHLFNVLIKMDRNCGARLHLVVCIVSFQQKGAEEVFTDETRLT